MRATTNFATLRSVAMPRYIFNQSWSFNWFFIAYHVTSDKTLFQLSVIVWSTEQMKNIDTVKYMAFAKSIWQFVEQTSRLI